MHILTFNIKSEPEKVNYIGRVLQAIKWLPPLRKIKIKIKIVAVPVGKLCLRLAIAVSFHEEAQSP